MPQARPELDVVENKCRTLIIDGERQFNRLIAFNLHLKGFACQSAYSEEEGLAAIESRSCDVAVLDPAVSSASPTVLIARVRAISRVPLIILTETSDMNGQIACLTAGADDFMIKPCSLDELAARILVAFRRSAVPGGAQAPLQPAPSAEIVSAGDLRLDLTSRRMSCGEREAGLQNLEARMLAELMRSSGKVITHGALMKSLGSDAPSGTVTSRVTMSKLRSKLRDVLGTDPIRAVYGVGYRFDYP